MTHPRYQRRRIITLRAEGLSNRQIARHLMLTPGQVSGVLHRARPKPDVAPLEWTPGSLRLLRSLSRNGATLAHLADLNGVTEAQVDRALWALLGRTEQAAALYLNGTPQ